MAQPGYFLNKRILSPECPEMADWVEGKPWTLTSPLRWGNSAGAHMCPG
jgi:hypothetical protein